MEMILVLKRLNTHGWIILEELGAKETKKIGLLEKG
jgi:hypothetical protein